MLIIIIVRLWDCSRLLGTFTPYQNFTPSFFFKSLLVKTLWSDDHANIVNAVVLGNVNFSLKLICFVNRFQSLVLLRICVVIINLSRQNIALLCKHYKSNYFIEGKLTLSDNFLFVCICPLILVSTTHWWFIRDHYVVICCRRFFPIFFQLNQVPCVCLAVEILAIDCVISFWLELGLNALGGRVERKSRRLW